MSACARWAKGGEGASRARATLGGFMTPHGHPPPLRIPQAR